MNAYHELIHDIAFAAYQSRQHAEAETLLKLLSRPDIDFHLLQSDVRLTDWAQLATLATVRDHSSSLADFMDTAAIASEMDLVIAVDTSLAHLAGALAVPVWLMLPWAADWRWMLERSDNPLVSDDAAVPRAEARRLADRFWPISRARWIGRPL